METTKIRISYGGKNQSPYLMIIKEHYVDDTVVSANVIYEENEHKSEIVFDEKIIFVKEYRIERIQS